MVTKFYAAGTLKHHLARNEWSRKLAMPLLVQVATGMLFLHSKGIVHHDLKADNVLVDDSADPPVAKIADFGLAKVRVSVGTEEKPGQAVQFRGNEGATVRFAPPEYFDGGEMGKAADAWMFGMMCYQVLSKGQEPYDYCPYDRVVSTKRVYFRWTANNPLFLANSSFGQSTVGTGRNGPRKRPMRFGSSCRNAGKKILWRGRRSKRLRKC